MKFIITMALFLAPIAGYSASILSRCEYSFIESRPDVHEWDLARDAVIWDREMFFMPDGRLMIVGLANHRMLNRKPDSGLFGNLRDVNTVYWLFEGGRIDAKGQLEIYEQPKSIMPIELGLRLGQSAWTPAGRAVQGPDGDVLVELMVPFVDFNKSTKQVFYRALYTTNFELVSFEKADPTLHALQTNNPNAADYRPFVRHGMFPELNRDGKWVGDDRRTDAYADFYYAVRVEQGNKLRSAIGVSRGGVEQLDAPIVPNGPKIDPDRYDEFEVPSPIIYNGELYLFTSATKRVGDRVELFVVGYRQDSDGTWHPVYRNGEVVSGPNQYYAAKFLPIPGRPGVYATIAFRTDERNLDVKPTEIGISYFDEHGRFRFAFD